MKQNNLYILLLVLISTSCTGIKHLSEGEKYYAGAEVKIHETASIKNELTLKQDMTDMLAPDPNAKILGSRPGVFFYHLAGEPKKEKGFKYWLRNKIGSGPVLLEDADGERMAAQLQSYLMNNGFFNADVTFEVKEKEHIGSIVYSAYPGQPYLIRNITYPEPNNVYTPVIEGFRKETLLDSGARYDLELLQTEQKRIEDFVEDQGFYYFDDNYLLYEADSAVGDHQVDLRLRLSKSTPVRARTIYEVEEVKIYPDYSVLKDTAQQTETSEEHDGYTYINDTKYIRQDVLAEAIMLTPGELYTHTAETYTLEHLLNLGTFKFVNIRFEETDSAKLISSIYFTPFPKKSIRLKLEAISKSNNFVGPAVGITFSNRNTFRGGELLEVSLDGAYNIQVGGQNDPPLTAYDFGVETSLTIPRLITPITVDYDNWRFLPNTRIRLGARIQERLTVFRLNSLEAGYGFLWRTNIARRHEFYPISLSYVKLSKASDAFNERLRIDPNLSRSLQDQFIIGATYGYTYNSKEKENSESKRNHFFLSARGDVSGNLLYLTQKATGTTPLEGRFQILRSAYSQYSKAAVDLRFYRTLSRDREVASRFQLGLARAYGNSNQVPFIKQFSAGGSNGIRAFQARSLGPGSYIPPDTAQSGSNFFLDQTGDILIEGSIEYRTKLIGVLEGALFMDAGNVWLWNENPSKPEGKFQFNRFYREIAFGTGVGLRFDFSFFILRFDLAFPLYDPANAEGERWVAGGINPLNRDWRQDNLILNIGIGYPF